ncbi:unnamed protein product [Vitrella brassicaformis CCMP3155]|uniref:Uncharacterized protein n=4 Tax=Vitrella brassicaformis TaxID=1169539 RepID=A0A0G4E9F1_VITBC|nr:unnamed protein product [Vitrella brassicaformis CCMP3155]|eukprot:CEL92221.1 unnamed protein product [Vitrella brassicaformis CCMP3155]
MTMNPMRPLQEENTTVGRYPFTHRVENVGMKTPFKASRLGGKADETDDRLFDNAGLSMFSDERTLPDEPPQSSYQEWRGAVESLLSFESYLAELERMHPQPAATDLTTTVLREEASTKAKKRRRQPSPAASSPPPSPSPGHPPSRKCDGCRPMTELMQRQDLSRPNMSHRFSLSLREPTDLRGIGPSCPGTAASAKVKPIELGQQRRPASTTIHLGEGPAPLPVSEAAMTEKHGERQESPSRTAPARPRRPSPKQKAQLAIVETSERAVSPASRTASSSTRLPTTAGATQQRGWREAEKEVEQTQEDTTTEKPAQEPECGVGEEDARYLIASLYNMLRSEKLPPPKTFYDSFLRGAGLREDEVEDTEEAGEAVKCEKSVESVDTLLRKDWLVDDIDEAWRCCEASDGMLSEFRRILEVYEGQMLELQRHLVSSLPSHAPCVQHLRIFVMDYWEELLRALNKYRDTQHKALHAMTRRARDAHKVMSEQLNINLRLQTKCSDLQQTIRRIDLSRARYNLLYEDHLEEEDADRSEASPLHKDDISPVRSEVSQLKIDLGRTAEVERDTSVAVTELDLSPKRRYRERHISIETQTEESALLEDFLSRNEFLAVRPVSAAVHAPATPAVLSLPTTVYRDPSLLPPLGDFHSFLVGSRCGEAPDTAFTSAWTLFPLRPLSLVLETVLHIFAYYDGILRSYHKPTSSVVQLSRVPSSKPSSPTGRKGRPVLTVVPSQVSTPEQPTTPRDDEQAPSLYDNVPQNRLPSLAHVTFCYFLHQFQVVPFAKVELFSFLRSLHYFFPGGDDAYTKGGGREHESCSAYLDGEYEQRALPEDDVGATELSSVGVLFGRIVGIFSDENPFFRRDLGVYVSQALRELFCALPGDTGSSPSFVGAISRGTETRLSEKAPLHPPTLALPLDRLRGLLPRLCDPTTHPNQYTSLIEFVDSHVVHSTVDPHRSPTHALNKEAAVASQLNPLSLPNPLANLSLIQRHNIRMSAKAMAGGEADSECGSPTSPTSPFSPTSPSLRWNGYVRLGDMVRHLVLAWQTARAAEDVLLLRTFKTHCTTGLSGCVVSPKDFIQAMKEQRIVDDGHTQPLSPRSSLKRRISSKRMTAEGGSPYTPQAGGHDGPLTYGVLSVFAEALEHSGVPSSIDSETFVNLLRDAMKASQAPEQTGAPLLLSAPQPAFTKRRSSIGSTVSMADWQRRQSGRRGSIFPGASRDGSRERGKAAKAAVDETEVFTNTAFQRDLLSWAATDLDLWIASECPNTPRSSAGASSESLIPVARKLIEDIQRELHKAASSPRISFRAAGKMFAVSASLHKQSGRRTSVTSRVPMHLSTKQPGDDYDETDEAVVKRCWTRLHKSAKYFVAWRGIVHQQQPPHESRVEGSPLILTDEERAEAIRFQESTAAGLRARSDAYEVCHMFAKQLAKLAVSHRGAGSIIREAATDAGRGHRQLSPAPLTDRASAIRDTVKVLVQQVDSLLQPEAQAEVGEKAEE